MMTAPVDIPKTVRVEMLEDTLRRYRSQNDWGDPVQHTICDKAADEIECLRAKLALAEERARFCEVIAVKRTVEVKAVEARLAEVEQRLQSASSAPKVEAVEPVAEAGAMPGTSGFTMACFRAEDVPIGTPLYTSPAPSPIVDDAMVERMSMSLERERSAVAVAVTHIERAIGGREHLRHPGRGPYAWDDERYQQEFGHALDEIEAALKPLRKIARDWTDCPTDADKVKAARSTLNAALSGAREGAEADAAKRFDSADWFYRTMDPDDSGDSPEQAIHHGMLGHFVVCEIASSFTGPTRYGFTAPVLDPDSDDYEFLHFGTEAEAIEAAQARAAQQADGDAA